MIYLYILIYILGGISTVFIIAKLDGATEDDHSDLFYLWEFAVWPYTLTAVLVILIALTLHRIKERYR